jgi:hypothetical protein
MIARGLPVRPPPEPARRPVARLFPVKFQGRASPRARTGAMRSGRRAIRTLCDVEYRFPGALPALTPAGC